MTRTKAKIVLFLAGFSLLISGSALAENLQRGVNLTPMVGYHVIDGGMDLDNEAIYGVALGYNITRNWGIEGDIRYTPTQTEKGSDDIDIWTLSLGGIYHFQPEQDLNPYLTFGAGGLVYEINSTSSNDEDYMGYWGAGFKYAMTESVALRLDMRHILDYRSDNRGSNHDGSDWRHHMQTMLGVTFHLGVMP